jgi:hypothetical protein
MSLLNRLERLFGRFAIENLSIYLVIGQVFVFLMAMLGRDFTGLIALVPRLVRQGQVWRIFTFAFDPPAVHPVLIAFSWYMFYLMGSALEQFWGAFRFNFFLFFGWALTVAAAFAFPQFVATNLFIAGSVLLAFAYLNPEFELLIFFILPLKIKWIARFQWAGYAYLAVTGNWPLRLALLASLGNFFLFFGRDIVMRIRTGRRQMAFRAKKFGASNDGPEPRHRCRVCGRTELSNRELDFRYCSKCANDECYCSDHLANHVHTTATRAKEG